MLQFFWRFLIVLIIYSYYNAKNYVWMLYLYRYICIQFGWRSHFGATLRTKEDTTRKRCSVVPFAPNDRAVVPVVISLRRTIHGNRTWEEEARITLSVIFRSTPRARYISQRVLKHSLSVFALARVSRCLFHLATLPEVLLFFLSLPFSLSPPKRLVRVERKRSEIK